MSFSRRTPKQSHRPRPLLLVEQLEKRELLNGSPLPALPRESVPGAQWSALASSVTPTLPVPAWQSGAISSPLLSGAQQLPAPGSKAPLVQVPLLVGPNLNSTPAGEGYNPTQLQQAYGFNQIALPAGSTFNSAGSGQTIAIIDAFDDPYLVSDLQTFDQTFNIAGAAHNAANTSFLKVVNETGGSTLPPTDAGYVDFGLETSLDVEWAHAMAPGANILLVEISSAFNFDDLATAIEYAARQPGVSVVSMSFGSGEWDSQYYLDNLFTTPLGHAGVSFVASAGDYSGNYPEYPGMSANVLSIGGTTLPASTSSNPNRALEYAWTDGGGGISSSAAEPAYQLGVQATGFRTGPDLAYDADFSTGVAVYDTLYANAYSPGNPWIQVGGTSMGAPQISSLVAITDQLRAAKGEGPLDGPNQLLPAIYQSGANDPKAFQDITSGNNGYDAGPGYDFATGLGTPNAQYLVPDLVAAYPKPAMPTTLYWTGDVDSNWNTPGNWSSVDPLLQNVEQSVLPTFATDVMIDQSGATILHDAATYDSIRSLTVKAPGVTLDLGSGTLDLSGSGGRGSFRVDRPGDAVTMEGGVLANAYVTAGTTLTATIGQDTYPELAGTQLDGTLNANQSGGDNGVQFTNGLILNGTIHLGGTSDLSAVLLAGYSDGNIGNQDNLPETISGSGTIQFGQSENGDAILNWGTFGTLTIGPGITVRGGGTGSLAVIEQSNFTGAIDIQGTIVENGGTLVIEAYAPAYFGWPAPGTIGWTNEGSIQATGAKLALLGGWINGGTIGADAHSTVFLGSPTYGDTPSSPDAPFESWSSTGSVKIAAGATVYVGGFLTTDQYLGASPLPGVTFNPTADTLFLDGTLDNSTADNPVSRGVLALSAATGPLQLADGTVSQGSITTSGSDTVQVSAITPLPDSDADAFSVGLTLDGAWLYNVTNKGIISANGTTITLQDAINYGTINGIAAHVAFTNTWANYGTLRVDAASTLTLGNSASTDPNFPPTLADGSAYAWNSHAIGTIAVADGATIDLGGLMTSDLFTAFPTLPGVSIHLAQDYVQLVGWLDNTPADNPVGGGNLVFTSATGVVNLNYAYISGGTLSTSGTGGVNSRIAVLNNVTNKGTVVVPASDSLYLNGNIVNNGTLTVMGGFVSELPGGSFTNNGSFAMSSGAFGAFQSSVLNKGTMTFTQAGISVFSNGPPVSMTNAGSVNLSSGYLYLDCSATNTAAITCSTRSGLTFYGTYDNSHGAISVDATSVLRIGYSAILGQNFPVLADFTPFAFNPSKVGKIHVADGAQVQFGGLLTTDQWRAFATLPGVSIDYAQDTIMLAGWLDNSPADNPKSHGVLALNAATGPLFLLGGYIAQGKITTTGADDLEELELGELDGVELDGNFNVRFEAYVLDNLKLNGTIQLNGELSVGYFDNAADTITGTGTITMGTAQTYQSVLVNLSNTSLTLGSGITIDAGAQYADLVSEGSQINIQGTVEDDTATSTLFTYGRNQINGNQFQDLANINAGTLTGGTWRFSGGATWRLDGADLAANAANLAISGAGTQVLDSIFDAGNNSLANFATNEAAGSFTVGAGYDFTGPAAFTNAGVVNIQSGAGFAAGGYLQSAGTTTVDGTLTANVAINGGILNGAGTMVGNLTNAALVTPGDTPGTLTVQGNYTQTAAGTLDIYIAGGSAYGVLAVSGKATLAGTLNVALVNGYRPAPGAWFTVLTFGTRSGSFGTENGLTIGKTRFFIANLVSNDLTLVVGPGVTVAVGTDLYIIGGLASNDQILVKPIGSSSTGSTGVEVTATLNGISTTANFNQAFGAIYVFGFAGNDTITLFPTLTIGATITAGNGNDLVTAGNSNNTVTLGNGNDVIALGNGNNVVVEGNGNDAIVVGNGDNLLVAGLGQHLVLAGNGSNILIDGSVQLTQGSDSLRQVLDDWMQYGALASNVSSIRSRVAVTFNSSQPNILLAGSGLDWFWDTYGRDTTDRKQSDLLD